MSTPRQNLRRHEFKLQCERALFRSALQREPIDVVAVYYGHIRQFRISLIGASISRAVYTLWPARGARVRKLRVYQHGKQIWPAPPTTSSP